MSQIGNLRNDVRAYTAQLLYMLYWTDDQLLAFKVSMAEEWLGSYIGALPAEIDTLVGNAMFWAWWEMKWFEFDNAIFLPTVDINTPPEAAEQMYKIIHRPGWKMKHPSTVYMEASFWNVCEQIRREERV